MSDQNNTIPKNASLSRGGSAIYAGMNFQNCVAAWIAARILAESIAPPPWGLHSANTLDCLHSETEESVDDLLVSTSGNDLVFIQVKHTITFSSSPNSAFASCIDQFVRQYLTSVGLPELPKSKKRALDWRRDRFLLIVGPNCPIQIRSVLPSFLKNVRSLLPTQTNDEAATNEQERRIWHVLRGYVSLFWQCYTEKPPAEDDIRQVLSFIHIETLDVETGGVNEREAKDMLRQNVLRDPIQADLAWNTLIQVCAKLAMTHSQANRNALQRALTSTGIDIQARSGIQQAESIDIQIRNVYPYPLVFPYRTLASLIPPRDQYSEQLRVAENILAFLGSLTLALIPPQEFKLSGFALKGYWQGGISPGHWVEICRKGADLLPKEEDNHLAQALRVLQKAKKQKQFRDKIDELVKMKNDLKYDRGPKVEEEFQDAALYTGMLLKDVMYALSFLTEHPLRLVRDVDLIRGTHRVILKTLRYTGDHPSLPVESCEYIEPLKKGDLYIQLEANRWISLFPFITVYNCSNCKSYETYFVDHWKDQKASLKSFERGHTQEKREVAIELSGY